MAVFITANLDLHTSPERPATDRLAWVDDALPDGENAALVHVAIDTDRCAAGTNTYQGEAIVWTEFFNKSVDRVYNALGPGRRRRARFTDVAARRRRDAHAQRLPTPASVRHRGLPCPCSSVPSSPAST